MEDLQELAVRAKEASLELASLKTGEKNKALRAIAEQIWQDREFILAANGQDVEKASQDGATPAFIDRLTLGEQRLRDLSNSVLQVAELPDPVGRETGWTRPNGLCIRRVQVPLGVIAVIYEARPNVTVDSAVLCFKAGNACILRGSSHALNSNQALVKSMRTALGNCGLNEEAIVFVSDVGHESVAKLTQLDRLIDCVIPRGGHSLISRVKEISKVPVIETGVGNCHLYVHKDANLDMALRILVNGKTQRIGVCNALESLLVDRDVAEAFLRRVADCEAKQPVVLHGDAETCCILAKLAGCPGDCGHSSTQTGKIKFVPASPEDWDKEYLSLDISVKIVDNVTEAIAHINKHSTGHSESIITEDWQAAHEFQRRVNSCAVYVNASTRFTDGGEFGFGAEIGISTQKLHARGPLGLESLTTNKYLIEGEGQIR